jgi:hypothetical protein
MVELVDALVSGTGTFTGMEGHVLLLGIANKSTAK